MGWQVKDLIVLVELSLSFSKFRKTFFFHFRNSAKCASDSDSVLFHLEFKRVDNSRLQEMGYSYNFFNTVF